MHEYAVFQTHTHIKDTKKLLQVRNTRSINYKNVRKIL